MTTKKLIKDLLDEDINKNISLCTADGKDCNKCFDIKGIEELEKIKSEIDALYGVYLFKERLVNETDVIQILDRHIKENKE